MTTAPREQPQAAEKMKTMIVGGIPDQNTPMDPNESSRLLDGVSLLAQQLTADGHELVVCSPFQGSADYAALKGLAETQKPARVEFHFPDVEDIRQRIDEWVEYLPNATVDKFPHHPPTTDDPDALQHAWLLSQLSALDRSSALISIGGRIGASAELLLKLAHGRGRLIVPLAALNGATARFLEAHRSEYYDILGEDVQALHNIEEYKNLSSLLSKAIYQQSPRKLGNRRVFISYARAQADDADFVEMTLRRRGFDVVRDEASFAPGHDIPVEIREKIFSSEIFLALWSIDYASSPWCFDEIEIALDRLEADKISLWVFQLDDTRIVPPRARDKLSYPAQDREKLKNSLGNLLVSRFVEPS
jgi:hypothetical protein